MNKAILEHSSHVATSKRYYYVNIYVNLAGTFLVISEYELESKTSSIATFVRLGDGF